MGEPIPNPAKKPRLTPEAASLGYEIKAGPYFWPRALPPETVAKLSAYLAKKHGIPLEKK